MRLVSGKRSNLEEQRGQKMELKRSNDLDPIEAGGAGSSGGWDYEVDDNGSIELPVGHHCETSPPFWHPAIKLTGAYTMPYDIQVSAAMQNLPGIAIRAVWTIDDTNVEGLGRPLSGGSAEVELVQPGTLYADRVNQLDVRLTKIFELNNGQRFKAMFDAYNLFNDAAPLVFPEDHPYGPNWQVRENILLARFVKFGAQFNF